MISGQLTNDSMPTLNGRAEAGATITIMDGLNPVQTLAPIIADNNGNWSYTFTTALSDGIHTLTVKATDPAGNTGPASLPFTVNVDATLPGAPSITNVTDLGNVAEGGFTNGTLPTISGTAEPGSTITIYNGSTLLGTTTASNTIPGAWSFTPSVASLPGQSALPPPLPMRRVTPVLHPCRASLPSTPPRRTRQRSSAFMTIRAAFQAI